MPLKSFVFANGIHKSEIKSSLFTTNCVPHFRSYEQTNRKLRMRGFCIFAEEGPKAQDTEEAVKRAIAASTGLGSVSR